MLHGITGLMNSGKTLYMTLQGYKQYRKGRTVISNYDLAYPHYKINKDFLISIGENDQIFDNVCFLLDELWIWLDCRQSQKNTVATYFFLQSSKDDSKIFFTAQHIGQIEKRVRDNMHILSNCQRVLKKGKKFVSISEEDRFLTPEYGYDSNIFKNLYIKVQTFKQKNYYIYSDYFPTKKEYIRIAPFVDLFDTTQKIKTQ